MLKNKARVEGGAKPPKTAVKDEDKSSIALPAGWRMMYSVRKMRHYYVNTATGTSQWLIPSEKDTEDNVKKNKKRMSDDFSSNQPSKQQRIDQCRKYEKVESTSSAARGKTEVISKPQNELNNTVPQAAKKVSLYDKVTAAVNNFIPSACKILKADDLTNKESSLKPLSKSRNVTLAITGKNKSPRKLQRLPHKAFKEDENEGPTVSRGAVYNAAPVLYKPSKSTSPAATVPQSHTITGDETSKLLGPLGKQKNPFSPGFLSEEIKRLKSFKKPAGVASNDLSESGPSRTMSMKSATISRGEPPQNTQHTKSDSCASIQSNSTSKGHMSNDSQAMTKYALGNKPEKCEMRNLVQNKNVESVDITWEEDMEVEAYSEEYEQMMTDIGAVREGLRNDSPEECFNELLQYNLENNLSEQPQATHQGIFIVLDTNILLEHLTFVEELLDRKFLMYGLPTLIFPWVIVQEIDYIKDNKRNKVTKNTQLRAVDAVHFLNNSLESQHPRVIGQTPTQSRQSVPELQDPESNDDHILCCCLQWKQKFLTHQVVLLTSDRHLRSKSLIIGIRATGKEGFSRWVKTLDMKTQADSTNLSQQTSVSTWSQNVLRSQNSTTTAEPSISKIINIGACKPMKRLKNKPQCKSPRGEVTAQEAAQAPSFTMRHLADETAQEMRRCITDTLGSVLRCDMEAVYGDIWESIVYRKPPWSFNDLLISINKHWIAVFGDTFGRDSKSNFLALQLLSQNTDFELKKCSKLLSAAIKLLRTVRNVPRHKAVADKSMQEVQQLEIIIMQVLADVLPVQPLSQLKQKLASCDDKSTCSSSQESNSSPSSSHVVQLTFQQVWEGILSVKDQVEQRLADRSVSNRSVLVQDFAQYCSLVASIHKRYSCMVNAEPKSSKDVSRFDVLINLLNQFAQLIQIQGWSAMNAADLATFHSSPAGREVLGVGLTQLENMMQAITQCQNLLSPAELSTVQAYVARTVAS